MEGGLPALGVLGEDDEVRADLNHHRSRRQYGYAAGLVGLITVIAMAAAGCAPRTGSPSARPSSDASSRAGAPASPSPEPPPPAGSCHHLDYRAAGQPTASRSATPCNGPHTSVTIAVGHLDQVLDGHLMAIDSHYVQSQLARRCPARLAQYVGGSMQDRRLSSFRAIWFGPSVAQADRGANWFRCDLVAVARNSHLAQLGRHLRGVLDRPGALARYGICGTAPPSSKHFDRVICSRKHSWRAFATIALPRHARYLGKPAAAAADQRCKSVATGRAHGALKYSWSFEWPTRQEWKDGQRFGLCWLPTH